MTESCFSDDEMVKKVAKITIIICVSMADKGDVTYVTNFINAHSGALRLGSLGVNSRVISQWTRIFLGTRRVMVVLRRLLSLSILMQVNYNSSLINDNLLQRRAFLDGDNPSCRPISSDVTHLISCFH